MNTLKRLCIKRGGRFGNSTKNLGTRETGNLGNWEPGKLGTWETGNLGNWEPGNPGTREPGNEKKFISSHQFDGEALERTPI